MGPEAGTPAGDRKRIALTIAGSDSGGGAGIQGDLKTFERWGVFGTSVITAITAQNTLAVTAWEPVSTSLVAAQLGAVLDDLAPDAIKTGMLGTADTVRAVAWMLRDVNPRRLVVDPVMIATSGDSLIQEDAVAAMRDELFPLARLITPNRDEASTLSGRAIRSTDDACAAARDIYSATGAGAVLVKGGHDSGNEVCDVLYDGDWTLFRHPRITSASTHGTGCALSAAIAAQLALGAELRESIDCATAYVSRAIASAPGLGAGHGPLNHSA